MANINFVENDGSQHEVDAADNFSLAEFATSTLISGIDADCS